MSFVAPCKRPDRDPDDWFIGRDGKQYPDDDLVPAEQVAEIRSAVVRLMGESGEQFRDRQDAAVGAFERDARRAALARRRHAKEACHEVCIMRLNCLDTALSNPKQAAFGTWGGYYEEELRELRIGIKRRNRGAARRI